MNCIEITNLSVNYNNQLALKNVNLTIDSGQMIAIIGQNGSGKSTLIKAILGLIPAQVRSHVTYIPQRESIDWDFPISVYEVVEMGRLNPNKWWKKSGQLDKQLIQEALEKVGMLSEASKQIGELSGGQQQRVFLARALVQNTSLLIMDEPFSGVDIRSQKVIFDVLTELKNAGKTMLIVHHDLSTVAAHFDHVIVLKNELLAFGETEKVFQSTIIEKAFGIPLNLLKND
jgi:ABC-type Mn2+/Zn2+ transport system ATPase subunit